MAMPQNFTATALEDALVGPDTATLQISGPDGVLMLELPLELVQRLIIVLPQVVQQMLAQP